MKPYSKDLRLKVLSAVDRGMPRGRVAEVFGVSVPTIKGWLKRRRETGGVEPVVMDNLGAHKGQRVKELIEARRATLLFLPAYSPDFSPIEEAFSKIKALLKKAAARTREALLEAIGQALEAVTAQDARGWFAHCGYTVGEQAS